MRELVAPLGQHLATKAAGALPAPVNGGDGVPITSWRSGPFGPGEAIVYLEGAANITMQGVKVAGRRRDKWWYVGDLKNAQDISITAAIGYSQRVTIVGVFDELIVYATSVVGGNVSYSFEPCEVHR